MEYAIHTLLSRTAHAMQNYLRPHLNKLGLSPGQPKVLRCLTARGPCSQRVLADYCELERDGFLVRRPSKTDRRTGEVTLTEKGREAFETWDSQLRQLEDRMLQGFSAQERDQLADFLARAYRNVGGRLL